MIQTLPYPLSRGFQNRWRSRSTTISTLALARQIDANVVETREPGRPHRRRFTFSDGTIALIHGRGRNHLVWTEYGLTGPTRGDHFDGHTQI